MKIKRILCLALILSGGLFGCATRPDAIDQLVASLSATYGIYLNGFPSGSNLPPSATPAELVSEGFYGGDSRLKPERVTSFRILKIRQVHVREGGNYIAVLVKTNLSRRIVLMQYVVEDGSTGGYWWRRIYNADPPYDHSY